MTRTATRPATRWYLVPEQEWLAPVLATLPKPKLALSVLLCRHRNVRWPIHGWQECLDCKGVRRYQIGHTPGRWGRL